MVSVLSLDFFLYTTVENAIYIFDIVLIERYIFYIMFGVTHLFFKPIVSILQLAVALFHFIICTTTILDASLIKSEPSHHVRINVAFFCKNVRNNKKKHRLQNLLEASTKTEELIKLFELFL